MVKVLCVVLVCTDGLWNVAGFVFGVGGLSAEWKESAPEP